MACRCLCPVDVPGPRASLLDRSYPPSDPLRTRGRPPGKVVEVGSPEELVEKKGKYWQMFAEKEGLGVEEKSGRADITADRLRKIWRPTKLPDWPVRGTFPGPIPARPNPSPRRPQRRAHRPRRRAPQALLPERTNVRIRPRGAPAVLRNSIKSAPQAPRHHIS